MKWNLRSVMNTVLDYEIQAQDLQRDAGGTDSISGWFDRLTTNGGIFILCYTPFALSLSTVNLSLSGDHPWPGEGQRTRRNKPRAMPASAPPHPHPPQNSPA
ncbi:MAG: hypothetical protein ABI905_17450 [Betaproteobacteria bacterium]